MADDMQQLLFAKQLADNAEYANETGLRNLFRIIETGSEEVVNGSPYIPGAFDAWKRLVDARPDLFTDAIVRELEERSQATGGAGYGQMAARYALKFLVRGAPRS